MKKKVILMLLAAVLAMMPVLTACGGSSPADTGDGGEAANDYAAVTLDNYGREITIEKLPQKVLTLGPNCSELFVALGLGDKIIGNTLDNHSRGPLPEYEEAYSKIPELNYTSATREAVVSSGADFIYGIDWEFGGEGLDVDELAQYGMTTYKNSATTLDQIYQEITDLGMIFQIEDRAKAFVDDQKARIDTVEDKVKDQTPVKVLVYDSGGEGVFTCTGTNFETLLIEKAGGKNVFDDITEKQWTTVSYEEVLKRNPDIILIHDYDSPSLGEKIDAIKSDPALAQLDCVKKERFAVITLESVLPGDRMAYTVESLAKAFYPDF
ncbi:MAG: ABC-type Fe3+-hydroxamate transport system, periplasmic component [Bacillota bacterium]|jgi:iron complex transport system substrate-binding protein|nr:ABC-type Fe3+-hydroxamate transport system, periplasmic component [Bacillota bacterium]